MKIQYVNKTFQGATLDVINLANTIVAEYEAAGFKLTLRQLYYQLVARGYIANKQTEYKRLGSIIADARLAGLVSWAAIEDRTRNMRGNSHWKNPEEIIKSAIYSYRVDKWGSQPMRPEVWIEKDALVGVIADVCQQLDVNYFSCRGYVSASEMWEAGHRRFKRYIADGQTPVIIHLGDHGRKREWVVTHQIVRMCCNFGRAACYTAIWEARAAGLLKYRELQFGERQQLVKLERITARHDEVVYGLSPRWQGEAIDVPAGEKPRR